MLKTKIGRRFHAENLICGGLIMDKSNTVGYSSIPPELIRWLVSSALLLLTQSNDSVDVIVKYVTPAANNNFLLPQNMPPGLRSTTWRKIFSLFCSNSFLVII